MPKITYKNNKGRRLPSVTTIIGNQYGPNKEALKYWAYKMGLENKDIRRESQKAMDTGSIVHEMFRCDLVGEEFNPDPYDKKLVTRAEGAFESVESWKALVGFEVLASEQSLVSEMLQTGGTPDAATIQSARSIMDLKKTKKVWNTHLIQLAAYGFLWNENHPDQPIHDYYVLQVDEYGSFSYHYFPEDHPCIVSGFEFFKHMRLGYEHEKIMNGKGRKKIPILPIEIVAALLRGEDV